MRAAEWPLLLLLLLPHASALLRNVPCAPALRAPCLPLRRSSPQCGPRVRIVSVGKTKEAWLQLALAEYMKRVRTVSLECTWVRDDAALLAEARGACIVLDERGKLCSSREFSEMLFRALEEGGARLSFVIGAADGLPEALRDGPHPLLSLSRMTLTHQMARLVLAEQIYRACEIRRGSKYHRG
uniref:Ribosomal RNA large subunit methyltransferase H n=1 Tax=Calcidiscus leptoporus TaxID=127549 RepID=A0A7S0NYP8_9EUKA|mmetsp:Transcript_39222/g.91756  ORF Transcript_39222/g.91756 Transcript_39222/m.91756 type:complete len:184 (+) Transcript_39222:247-798(+)